MICSNYYWILILNQLLLQLLLLITTTTTTTTTLQLFLCRGNTLKAFSAFFSTMNNNKSSSSTNVIMKEVRAVLPEQSEVAVQKRKEKELEAEQVDYGSTDGQIVSVTVCQNNESDSEDSTIRMGKDDSDDEFTPMNDADSDNEELVNATRGIEDVHIVTSDGEGLPAVADTAEEKKCGDAFRSRGFGGGKVFRGYVCSSRCRGFG